MQYVRWREGGETGGMRLRPGALVDPRDNAVDINGRGSRDVLQVRFREPPIGLAVQSVLKPTISLARKINRLESC